TAGAARPAEQLLQRVAAGNDRVRGDLTVRVGRRDDLHLVVRLEVRQLDLLLRRLHDARARTDEDDLARHGRRRALRSGLAHLERDRSVVHREDASREDLLAGRARGSTRAAATDKGARAALTRAS